MKQAFHFLRDYWARFIRLLFPDRNANQHTTAQHIENPDDVGMLYYSIPGRSFTGSIYKGRILK
ncbi:hypothetical protein [Spirosoma endbachense]|uniref:Uncharacterized protein n=1 Tax=Spirosoma endbachense TaxID=2666025 RepID=A0A6P1VYI6_9BACT|nr:hypothetical protein [Spirosoma endbachense]QHV96779.1 hypothetical protein GJR95_17975 [Spirosoma endbachense]